MHRPHIVWVSIAALAACTGEPATTESGGADAGEAQPPEGDGETGCDERFADPDDIEHTLVALRRSDEFTIDGVLDEADLAAAPAIEFTDPDGDSENRVRAWAVWDPLHLYVAVEVEDDELSVADDVSTYRNDGVELFIDTARDGSEQMHRDHYQWLIPIEGDAEARRGTPEGGPEPTPVTGLDYAVEPFDAGYRMELEVSLAEIGVDATEGLRLGLLLTNNDRDGDDHVPFSWTWVHPYADPSQWGELRLAGVRCGAEPAPAPGDDDGDGDEECAFPPEGEYGADANDTCDPIGGGAGYSRTVTGGDVVVSTRSELIAALDGASAGDVVYVDDDAEIQLRGSDTLSIPGGVTLASGRGHQGSEGALLYSDDRDTPQLIQTLDDGVRITGLRIRGPFTGTERISDHSRGIRSRSNFIEVDNNEIWGFTHFAVNANDGHIHHNYIHHNQRGGLGYGVQSSGGPGPLIEANHFDFNRHSIAAPGCSTCGYVARYNLVGPNRNGHAFDLHETRCETDSDGEYLSGDYVHIHHNTFLGEGRFKPIGIRGNPRSPSEVHHNWFEETERTTMQKNGTKRLTSFQNQIGVERELIEDGPPVFHWTGSVSSCE